MLAREACEAGKGRQQRGAGRADTLHHGKAVLAQHRRDAPFVARRASKRRQAGARVFRHDQQEGAPAFLPRARRKPKAPGEAFGPSRPPAPGASGSPRPSMPAAAAGTAEAAVAPRLPVESALLRTGCRRTHPDRSSCRPSVWQRRSLEHDAESCATRGWRSELPEPRDHLATVLTAPVAVSKPQRMLHVIRAGGPPRIDEAIVKLLLHVLNDFVPIRGRIIDIGRQMRVRESYAIA